MSAYTVYAVVYRSFWGNLKEIQGRIESAEHKFYRQVVLLESLSSKVGLRQLSLESYRQKESDGGIRSKMLAALQELSSQENVRIADMKPAAIRMEESYKEFPVSMMLEGEFVNIMKFFYYAESEKYGFRIKEFRFSQSRSAKAVLRCKVVLSRIFLNAEQ